MLTSVEEASDLVRHARQTAGLSARGLAERAYVSASTITRVESGRVDPTVGMLRRILDAAGQDLHVSVRPKHEGQRPALADLTDAWNVTHTGDRPDWTRFRAFIGQLIFHPEQVETAIARRPPKSGSLMVDALLAGIAEKLADDAGLLRPSWTRHGPVLSEEWLSPGTPRMQAAVRAATPPQLLQRGLLIDARSLWRDRATIGA